MTLSGEGEYNLNNIKEIDFTNSFIGLPEDVRKCQKDEHVDDCKRKEYLEEMRLNCGCLPIAARLPDDEVRFIIDK